MRARPGWCVSDTGCLLEEVPHIDPFDGGRSGPLMDQTMSATVIPFARRRWSWWTRLWCINSICSQLEQFKRIFVDLPDLRHFSRIWKCPPSDCHASLFCLSSHLCQQHWVYCNVRWWAIFHPGKNNLTIYPICASHHFAYIYRLSLSLQCFSNNNPSLSSLYIGCNCFAAFLKSGTDYLDFTVPFQWPILYFEWSWSRDSQEFRV